MIRIYRKSKALGAIIRNLKQMDSAHLQSHRVSIAAYEDPYIVGFLYGVVSQIAIHVGKIRFPEDLMEIRFKGFSSVFGNQNAVTMLDRAGRYAESSDPDFVDGINAAQDAFQSINSKVDRVPPQVAVGL